MQSSSATLPNLSRPQLWSSHLAGAHERHAFGPQLWTSCPAGTRKAEGSAALPSGVQQRCPRAPTPEPGKGRRPKNRHSKKGETCFCPGVLSSPCPGLLVAGLSWFRVAGSPALPLRVPVCFVPPDVSFPWPRASRSSSQREGRRVKRRGTDPRTGTGHRSKDRLFQVPSTYVFLVYFVAPAMFFPFLFATLFSLMCLSFGMLSGYPRLLTIGLKLSSVWIGEVLFALGHHCLDVPRSVRARHLRSLNVMLCSPWFWCSYAVCRVPPFLRPILCLVRGGTRRVIIVIA